MIEPVMMERAGAGKLALDQGCGFGWLFFLDVQGDV